VFAVAGTWNMDEAMRQQQKVLLPGLVEVAPVGEQASQPRRSRARWFGQLKSLRRRVPGRGADRSRQRHGRAKGG
jgi:hypothetical protein